MQPETAGVLDQLNRVRAGPRGGPPVLFLHAVGLDLTWWDGQFAALAGERDLLAFDLPGHGLSAPLDGPPSFQRLALAAARVVEEAAAGPADVVGVSVGGMIAQALALIRPDLVRSLTLVASLCTFPDPVRAALRERAAIARQEGMTAIAPMTQARWFPEPFRNARPDIMDRAAKSLLRHDREAHAAMWDMIADLDLETELPRIACPVLVVAGAEDPNAPPAAGRRIAELISGAAYQELAGVGHLPPIEAPTIFNDLLRKLLTVGNKPTG